MAQTFDAFGIGINPFWVEQRIQNTIPAIRYNLTPLFGRRFRSIKVVKITGPETMIGTWHDIISAEIRSFASVTAESFALNARQLDSVYCSDLYGIAEISGLCLCARKVGEYKYGGSKNVLHVWDLRFNFRLHVVAFIDEPQIVAIARHRFSCQPFDLLDVSPSFWIDKKTAPPREVGSAVQSGAPIYREEL